jgi:hypothetical protein
VKEKLGYRFALRARYNEPEFVTLFPFAQDSFSLYYMVQGAFR